MFYRDGTETKAPQGYGAFRLNKGKPGLPASPLGFPEHIGEAFLHLPNGCPVSIDRQGLFPGQGPHIVQAVEVIRMGVGKEHRIEMPDSRPDCLKPEFRPRVDYRRLAVSSLHKEGGPHPLIFGVGGAADGAVAAQYRNAVGSAGTENHKLHGYSMMERGGVDQRIFPPAKKRKLVIPGLSVYTGTMVNPELVKTLDYILNRCDEAAIEAVAAAVVRRRRDLSVFGGVQNLPDPQRMARELSGQVNIGASIEGLRESIRDMAVRIIKREAPELTEAQIGELTRAWIPGSEAGAGGSGEKLPRELLFSMVDQFVAFSLGRMSKIEEKGLRDELGSWPERYWNAFPPVVRLIVSDYLKGETGEKEFRSKLETAVSLGEGEG